MKQIIRKIKSLIPQELPQNSADVIAFAKDVVELAGQDPENKNLIFAVVSEMMRLDISRIRASKNLFVKQVKRALTNAAAFSVLEGIRNDEKARKESEQQ